VAIKRYRTAFLIQARTTAKDAVYGQAEPTWTDGTRVQWGEIVEGSANVKRAAQQRRVGPRRSLPSGAT
jgi:hypothetical protein